ncbi:sensor histidine kinase [Phaeovulum sp.]|uniref:sensor histidine kinase n=1 Tax=Phaeovulum sp. TaxID=2934796 RepID=UPI00272F86EE|nr:sensor histidine kinase [Phaeovulum sp.]MDP1669133.1 sensor histidine kinase [Phaeovulum sp.]MDZ4117772.1 sensor histidine kinase [Phaeovulum sp.]
MSGNAALSLRARLVLQLLVLAAVLAVLLFVAVRTVAGAAAEETLDGVLGAATLAIADELRGGEDGVTVDLPHEAFSILGSISEDRIFYRIAVEDTTITGYADLPMPEAARGPGAPAAPTFYTTPFRNTEVRVAMVQRVVLAGRLATPVTVLVAQTRSGQAAIAARVANRAASIGLGVFALAAALSIITAGSVLRPINRLAEAVARRGPRDLRAVDHPTPAELRPLLESLNGLIARLRAALTRTETFIAEAAHHIRTPLATVRARAETALRKAETEEARETLRTVIRAVEESARSASQLLDHATVVYRSDRPARETVDLARLIEGLAQNFGPVAGLKDVQIATLGTESAVEVRGDRLLIEAALRNLLDNAVKYSPADTDIALRLSRSAEAACIEVADRGRGLSGSAKAELTRRFARGANVGDVVGSGLGLTIVEEVAAAHGGRFELTEREGGGTCARFWLPLG